MNPLKFTCISIRAQNLHLWHFLKVGLKQEQLILLFVGERKIRVLHTVAVRSVFNSVQKRKQKGMDDAYETLFRQDKGCDTLEPGPSVPSVGMSFTLRAWWRGWNTGEENVPSDRRLCLTVTLFYNFVFFLLPSPRNTLSYRLCSLCPPDIPLYPWWNGVHADLSAAFFQSVTLNRAVI